MCAVIFHVYSLFACVCEFERAETISSFVARAFFQPFLFLFDRFGLSRRFVCALFDPLCSVSVGPLTSVPHPSPCCHLCRVAPSVSRRGHTGTEQQTDSDGLSARLDRITPRTELAQMDSFRPDRRHNNQRAAGMERCATARSNERQRVRRGFGFVECC